MFCNAMFCNNVWENLAVQFLHFLLHPKRRFPYHVHPIFCLISAYAVLKVASR